MVSVTVTLTTDGCCACWETETEWRVQAVEMSDCHQWLSRQHWTCVHLRAMCKHLESASHIWAQMIKEHASHVNLLVCRCSL